MNVGRVLFASSLRSYGGGERWMLDAASGLRHRGCDVAIVARPGGELVRRGREMGIDVAAVEMRGDFDPVAIVRIASLVRRFAPHVVVPNLDREIRLTAAAIAASGRRRDTRLIPRRGSEFPLKNKWHYRLVYTRMVDRVIVNSIATDSTIRINTPWLGTEKTKVIYNGVGVRSADSVRNTRDQYRRRLRTELGAGDDSPIAVLVGELNERKGQRFVIDAAPQVLARFPEARFVFVGDGEGREDIERRVSRAGLGDRIHLVGFRRDAEALIAGSDVALLPSRVEGFGYALVEAMAAGIPVVATRASSIPEVVDHGATGFLHEYGDSDAIARYVLRLYTDRDEADRMGAEGYRVVVERFSIDRMLDDLQCLFFEPLTSSTARPQNAHAT